MSNTWIDVTEELPELDEEVNVWLDYKRRQVATMRYAGKDDNNRAIWYWHNSEDLTTLTPKKWQALPTPPTKQEQV